MIFFSDKYTDEIKKLRETLDCLDTDMKITVLEDKAFLPGGVFSPYEYYISKQNKKRHVERKLFYDALPVPEYWEVRDNSKNVGIYYMGCERAVVYFHERREERKVSPPGSENVAESQSVAPVMIAENGCIVSMDATGKGVVQRIEWRMEDGRIYRVDFYNKYGLKYASEFRGADGTVETKVFYSDTNQEVIVEYPENDVVTLLENGAVKAFFNSHKEFIEYFILEVTADKKMALFIQNYEMLEALDIKPDAEQAWGFALCPDDDLLFQYENLGGKNGFRFYEIPEHYPVNGAKSEALILTRYDRIERIEELTQELPEVTFHIGANTLMSDRLMNLEKQGNVKLYPGLSQDILDELWDKCDFYLDINLYDEIRDAVNVAQQKNLLVMGFENTVHHKELIVNECMYSTEEYRKLALDIRYMLQCPERMRELLTVQQRKKIEFYKKMSIPAATDCQFTSTVLRESYGDNLALSWTFEGSAAGFLIYDAIGELIYETQNIHQHYLCIEGHAKENFFVVKAYVETLIGKMVVAESETIYLEAKRPGIPQVSLVMAAYNAEEYIVRSIDTALAQSFLDLELIIVDDGSTDSTASIIEWYAEKYSDVIGIHQPNGRTPSARNTGITHARGNYIAFMDSDDMLHPTMIANLFNSIQSNHCDIAITSIYLIKESGYESLIQYPLKENVAVSTEEFFNMHFTKGCMFATIVCNKLYRTELVKRHLFPILPIEDDAWTPCILSYADTICFRNDCSYEYDRIKSDTVSKALWTLSREDMFEIHKNATMFYLENGNPKRLDLLKKLANRQLMEMRKAFGDDEYEKLWEKIEKEY